MKLHNWRKINFSPLFSIALALLIGALLIAIGGNNPIKIYAKMINGIVGSRSGIYQTLLQTTPLLFSGLAVVIGMRGGLLNLGIEGQLYIGALASALVALNVTGLPAFIHIPLCMLAAMAGGAIWAFIPVIMKLKCGAHEVVTGLMLNYIAELFVEYATNYPLKEVGSSVAQTKAFPDSAILPKLFPRSQVTIAIVIAVILAIAMAWALKKTIIGYKITMVGSSLTAASAAGIDGNRIMIITMMISGMFGGLVGSMEVLGTYGRLINGFSPGYGFEGLAVAVVGSSPIAAIFSSLLFGALRAGGMALSMGTNLSAKFITALQGIIIVLLAAPSIARITINKIREFRQKRKTQYQVKHVGAKGGESV
jgi:general nucleoside transport system permease protein